MDVCGIIFASVDCDADAVEDWNRWYDLEHLPPNIALPGIMTGKRYVAPPELHDVREPATASRASPTVVGCTSPSTRSRGDPAQVLADMTTLPRHARGRGADVRTREEDRARRRRDDVVVGRRRSRAEGRSRATCRTCSTRRSAWCCATAVTTTRATRSRRRRSASTACTRCSATGRSTTRRSTRPVPAGGRSRGGDARGARRPRRTATSTERRPRRAVPAHRAVRLRLRRGDPGQFVAPDHRLIQRTRMECVRAGEAVRTIAITGSGVGDGGRAAASASRPAGDRVIGIDVKNADVEADLGTAEGRASAIERVGELSGGALDGLVTLAGPRRPARTAGVAADLGQLLRHRRAAGRAAAAPRPGHRCRRRWRSARTPPPASPGSTRRSSPVASKATKRRPARSRVTGESLSTYPVTKTALSWWVRRHAPTPEWAGEGITLNAVAPGAIQTPLLQEGLDHPTVGPMIDGVQVAARPQRPTRGDRRAHRLPARARRAVLLRVGPVLRRWDGRAVPQLTTGPNPGGRDGDPRRAQRDRADQEAEGALLPLHGHQGLGRLPGGVRTATRPWTPPRRRPNSRSCTGARNIRQFVQGSVGPVVTVHHGHMPEIEITSPTTARGSGRCRTSCRCPKAHRSG